MLNRSSEACRNFQILNWISLTRINEFNKYGKLDRKSKKYMNMSQLYQFTDMHVYRKRGD